MGRTLVGSNRGNPPQKLTNQNVNGKKMDKITTITKTCTYSNYFTISDIKDSKHPFIRSVCP